MLQTVYNINVLKRNIIQSNVYTINKLSDVKHLNHNSEHLNVSKVYKKCFNLKTYGPSKINPCVLGRQDHAHTVHVFTLKNKPK